MTGREGNPYNFKLDRDGERIVPFRSNNIWVKVVYAFTIDEFDEFDVFAQRPLWKLDSARPPRAIRKSYAWSGMVRQLKLLESQKVSLFAIDVVLPLIIYVLAPLVDCSRNVFEILDG